MTEPNYISDERMVALKLMGIHPRCGTCSQTLRLENSSPFFRHCRVYEIEVTVDGLCEKYHPREGRREV